MSSNYKVLAISPAMPPIPCGVGDYSSTLFGGLDTKQGVEIKTVSASNQSDYTIKTWNIATALRLRKIVKVFKPDIIHYQFPTRVKSSRLFNLLMARLLRPYAKSVITVHEIEEYNSRLSQAYTMLVANGFNNVVTTNSRHQDNLRRLGINSTLIPIAHPFADSVTDRGADPAKRKAGSIGFFGFVEEHKQVSELVDAINKLNSSGKDTKMSLTIIGPKHPDNNYHKQIEAKLNPDDRWISGLSLNDISKELMKLQLLVLPFKHGGSAKNSTLLAGLATETPVLTTYPVDKEIAKSVNACSIEDLAEHLGSLTNNQKTLDLRAASGLALVKASHTWKHVINQHEQLYESILGKNQN